MFASFKKLKFGTKMNLIVAIVVLVCIGIMALIILMQSRSTLNKEAKTMLYNVAKRHANNIAPIFDESFVLVCIGIMALIILMQSRSTLNKEAKTMLYNVAKRHANNIAPIFDESFALLENTQGVINNFLKVGITLDNKTIDESVSSLLDTSNWAKYAYVFLFEPYAHNGLQKDFVSKNGKSGYLMIYRDDDPTRIGGVHRVNAESKVLDFPAVQNAIQEKRSIFGVPVEITLEGESFHAVNAVVPLFSGNQLIGVLGMAVQNAIQEKRSIFGVPVEITLEGESFHAVNAVVPLFSGNQLIGVLGMSINLDTIVQQIVLNKENSVYENDFISILSTGGVYAASDDISLFGKKIAEVNTHPSLKQITDAQAAHTSGVYEYINRHGKEAIASDDISLFGKKIAEVNTHPSLKQITDAQAAHTSGVYEYINRHGKEAIGGVSTFEVWRNTGSFWSVLVSAPQTSVYAPLRKITITMLVSVLASFASIVFIISLFVRFALVKRLSSISHTLFDSTFEVWRNTGSFWSVLVSAPQTSVYAPLRKITITMLVSVLASFASIVFIISLFVRFALVKRLSSISHTLFEFFKYLNHQRKDAPHPLKIVAQDELGEMGNKINENIEKTKLQIP